MLHIVLKYWRFEKCKSISSFTCSWISVSHKHKKK